MKRDKALLPFGGYESMAEYQYRRLEKIFKNVYISTKKSKFDANLIIDSSNIYSPMVAIESALSYLKEDFFLISVDVPLLSIEVIEKLREEYLKNSSYDLYILKSINGLEPMAAIYTKNLLSQIREYIDKDIHRLNYLTIDTKYLSLYWDKVEEFLNINYEKTYNYLLDSLK